MALVAASESVTFYVLFAIEIATRRVEIAGITTSPDCLPVPNLFRNHSLFSD